MRRRSQKLVFLKINLAFHETVNAIFLFTVEILFCFLNVEVNSLCNGKIRV